MTSLQPELAGDGFFLRPWHPDDAAALAREVQDPEIVRWLGIDLPYTVADAAKFIAMAARRWDDGTAAHFVVDCGEPAGYI